MSTLAQPGPDVGIGSGDCQASANTATHCSETTSSIVTKQRKAIITGRRVVQTQHLNSLFFVAIISQFSFQEVWL